MLNKKKVAIIFPCRNESKIIADILPRVPKFIDQKIVVDNRSTDDTTVVAKKKGATIYKEKRHIKGIGYGYAIQTGIAKTKTSYIVLMDGDKTYPMSHIKKVISYMEKEEIDFVSCKRFPLASWKNMSLVRFFGCIMLTFATNLLFGTKFKDILSGMWVFRKNIVPYLDLTPGDWNMSISIKLSAALSYHLKFAEYHIPYHDRKQGSSKQVLLKTGLSHLVYLAQLKYQHLVKTNYGFKKTLAKINS